MTKMRWAAMGLMLFGAYVVQAFGCSSSPAAPATSGGACCSCTVSDPATGCSNARTLSAGAGVTVTDCNSFCAGKISSLQMCPGATSAMIGGTGVACPTALGGDSGAVVTIDGAVVHPPVEGGAIGGGDLGSQCTTDAECQTGFTCTKPADNLIVGTGSGFPNGICTVDCTSDPTMCTPLNARCVGFDPDPNAVNPKAICLETCKIGPPPAGIPKCHNRPDLACSTLGDMVTTACTPSCDSDTDCPGRKCDLASGFCTDMPTAGAPIGTACTANGATDPCAGFCIPLDAGSNGMPVPGVCTATCTFGSVEGCGWRRTPAAGGPTIGGCLSPLTQNGDVGDQGICYQLCDTVDDCLIKGANWVCDHDIPNIETNFNHGVCLINNTTDAGGQ